MSFKRSKVHMLRCFVNQRLTAAAQEICGLFERTLAEYEEELCSSQEENQRHRKLLDAETRRPGPLETGFPADLKRFEVVQEEVLPEQQVWSTSLDQGDQEDPEPPHIKQDQEDPEPPHIKEDQEDPEPPHIKEDQEDPEPPHIKEEEEELWTNQEGEQLEGLEEAGIRFPFSPVKSEDEEEEAQSSHLHQRLTEHMETEADGEDYRGPGPDWRSGPGPDWRSGPHRHPGPDKTSRSSETGDSDDGQKLCGGTGSGNRTSSCSEENLRSRDGTFTCQFCGKTFSKTSNLTRHLRVHTGEKPFSCSVCTTSFSLRSTLVHHMRVHTGEKPFGCSVCGRRFSKKTNLTAHVVVHTEERPFRCSVCDKRFTWSSQVKNHKCRSQSGGFQD